MGIADSDHGSHFTQYSRSSTVYWGKVSVWSAALCTALGHEQRSAQEVARHNMAGARNGTRKEFVWTPGRRHVSLGA